MPTEKPRVTFTISAEKLAEVENYRFDNKIKNQTQAILSLIEKGLSGYETEQKSSPDATKDAPGEKLISLEESNQLLVALGFIQEGEQLSDDDFTFLSQIIGLLDTWFGKRR